MIKGRHTGFTQLRKHVLEIRPSVTLAKNVKRKELVFALLNREIIDAMWGQLIGSNESE